MTNIGFVLNPTKGWLGGVNYFRNLFLAIDSVAGEEFRILVFVSPTVDDSLVNEICRGIPTVRVIRTSLLNRRGPAFLMWKLSSMLLQSDFFAHLWLRRYGVRLYSHSAFLSSRLARTVNWIPDFQHLQLPEFFTEDEISMRDKSFRRMAAGSDAVMVSSEAALRDFNGFAPEYAHKGRVIHFVSQVPDVYWGLGPAEESRLHSSYGIAGTYFYLPNQFWKHKNHLMVFEAISLLRQRGIAVTLVCTGALEDYRNPSYIERVRERIRELGVEDSVKLLGIVPYADVYALIRFSTAVINPSLFEGWSSTVEECKSVGKRLVLSDIPVHREQAGGSADFFEKDSAEELSLILERILSGGVPEAQPLPALKSSLLSRTRAYGASCLALYREVLS